MIPRTKRPRLITGPLYILAAFVLLGITQARAEGVALSFPSAQMTLGNVFRVIEEDTDYTMVFYASGLDTEQTVNLPSGEALLKDILEILSRQICHGFIVRGKYIIVNTAVRTVPGMNGMIPVPARTGDRYDPGNPLENKAAPNPRPVTGTVSETTVTDNATLKDTISRSNHYSYLIPADIFLPENNSLPRFAVKTNLLYGAATLTPNIGFEAGIADRHSLEISFSHNSRNRKASLSNNDKLLHLIVRPEYRYWFCERYNGHFFGANAFYGAYNVSGKTVPLLFKKEYRYRGYAAGAGISYGYILPIAKRWGLEFNIGVGAAYLNYDRYDCRLCSTDSQPRNEFYFGPTRAGISLTFLLK